VVHRKQTEELTPERKGINDHPDELGKGGFRKKDNKEKKSQIKLEWHAAESNLSKEEGVRGEGEFGEHKTPNGREKLPVPNCEQQCKCGIGNGVGIGQGVDKVSAEELNTRDGEQGSTDSSLFKRGGGLQRGALADRRQIRKREKHQGKKRAAGNVGPRVYRIGSKGFQPGL